jgi:hypothetical protein
VFSVTPQNTPAGSRKPQAIEIHGSQFKSVPVPSPYAYQNAFPLLRAKMDALTLLAPSIGGVE